MVDSIPLIQKAGRGTILANTNIEHAYKLIPIHPDNNLTLGIIWFQHYISTGYGILSCQWAPGPTVLLFETFSEALQHQAQWKGGGDMCHVLDCSQDKSATCGEQWGMPSITAGLCSHQARQVDRAFVHLVVRHASRGLHCCLDWSTAPYDGELEK